ncbi:MAG TPA: T9SS type A sorting domain-containing protein, partial [Chitinophagales bacterium]|nr:T9SS type A sorting domain-containing protein [Chitinophagales bacterium]
DHYSDDGPPNVIPFPWWYTSEGSVREAIEYTAQLKLNTEPKRLTSWCQLTANTWGVDHQAEDYIINFQFWSHVSNGAKGIHYFLATPESKSDYPVQWEEALYSTRQLSAVKNLCMYGECWQGVKVNSGNVIANGLVSENALMITVLNNSIDYTVNNVFNHDWIPTIQPVDFQLEVTVPDWIPLQQFYEVLSTGKINIGNIVNTGGRTYQISGTINTKSQVFVIGSNDNVAPEQVTRINVPDKISPNNFTLSWSEPFDNFGVRGYYIKADNDIIDTVFAPIWESAGKVNACLVGYWSVIPFDDAGNTGQPGVLTVDWSGVGSGTPVLYQQPQSITVNAGNTAVFSIADSAATGVAYTWQADTGNGVWANLANGANYGGVFTSSLTVFGTQHNTGYKFRCSVTVGCGQLAMFSDSALLTVTGSVGINENLKNDFRVFPNPANESIIVSVSDVYPHTAIIVCDVNGRPCLSADIKREKTVFDVSALGSGVYFVRLYQHGLFSNVVKLIKL